MFIILLLLFGGKKLLDLVEPTKAPPPPAPHPSIAPSPSPAARKYCPQCGAEIPLDATFCLKCGTLTISPIKYCPKCGSEIPLDARFCPKCRTRTPSPTPPTPSEAGIKAIEAKPVVKSLVVETPPSDLDLLVYDYIVRHGGTISMSQAAENLGVSVEELKASIRRLLNQGRIASRGNLE